MRFDGKKCHDAADYFSTFGTAPMTPSSSAKPYFNTLCTTFHFLKSSKNKSSDTQLHRTFFKLTKRIYIFRYDDSF